MSTHPQRRDTQPDTRPGTGPGAGMDPLGQDIHATFTGLPLPERSSIDLSRVRRRGRRRRSARRVLIAAPAAVLLVGAALTWQPWDPGRSGTLAPAQQRTSAPAPSTPAPSQAPPPSQVPGDPRTIATAAVHDALLSMDPDLAAELTGDLTSDLVVGTSQNTDSGQLLGWFASYRDERSAPPARLHLKIQDAEQHASDPSTAIECTEPAQCVRTQLAGGLTVIRSTGSMVQLLQGGGQVRGTLTTVFAPHPDGKVISAEAVREVGRAADLGPQQSLDSPLITAEDLQVLVTDPALAQLPAPTAPTGP